MDEEITIIDSKTRNEKIKNFFMKNKKKLISIFSILILIASSIYRYLFNLRKKNLKNSKYFRVNIIKKNLISLGATKIDYLEKINLKFFRKSKKEKNKYKIFVAYYIEKVRLIDNI